MKAVVINEYGDPSVFQYQEMPEPEFKADEVLIRVMAAGINPVDWRIRKGQLRNFIPCDFPAVLGREVAGTIEKCGSQVEGLFPGDEVFCFLNQDRMKWGGYAEFVPVQYLKVAHKPKKLSFIEAAGIPLAGTTAWQCLFDIANLSAGQTLFVHAAAGGVGTYAVQIAKWAGARVIGTASKKNHEYLRQLGVDLIIDYQNEDFVERVRAQYPEGVDVVLASLTGKSLIRSAEIIKPEGKMPLIAPTMNPEELNLTPVAPQLHMAKANAKHLDALAKLADEGRLKVHIDQVLPLDQAAEAHRISEQGHVRGKLILEVQS